MAARAFTPRCALSACAAVASASLGAVGLMRAQGLCAGRARRRKPVSRARPTASTPSRSPPIGWGRDFTAAAPNRQWVADLTGIPTHGGWLYLARILDVYSRRAIGYAMDTDRDEQLVGTALDMAHVSRRLAAGLLHHSDRGSQYTSTGYRGLLECQGIRVSMSGKGEPYDNALMESFVGTLKAECVERQEFQTPDQARACIFEYLEVFYNRQRLHSSLGYRSPMAFEQMPVVT